MINVQGSDHHSTVTRVRAGPAGAADGLSAGLSPDYVLYKMITVMRGGEEVKISKRAGSYVTIRELIDEAGRDAVRYFLVSRKSESEFVFDIDLARSQSDENPVYYVQYAHARMCSVLRQAGMVPADAAARGSCGRHWRRSRVPGRKRCCAGWPTIRRSRPPPPANSRGTRSRAIIEELARDLHSYYNAERFLVDDANVRDARLALAVAAAQVLKNGLAVLSISAPEQM